MTAWELLVMITSITAIVTAAVAVVPAVRERRRRRHDAAFTALVLDLHRRLEHDPEAVTLDEIERLVRGTTVEAYVRGPVERQVLVTAVLQEAAGRRLPHRRARRAASQRRPDDPDEDAETGPSASESLDSEAISPATAGSGEGVPNPQQTKASADKPASENLVSILLPEGTFTVPLNYLGETALHVLLAVAKNSEIDPSARLLALRSANTMDAADKFLEERTQHLASIQQALLKKRAHGHRITFTQQDEAALTRVREPGESTGGATGPPPADVDAGHPAAPVPNQAEPASPARRRRRRRQPADAEDQESG